MDDDAVPVKNTAQLPVVEEGFELSGRKLEGGFLSLALCSLVHGSVFISVASKGSRLKA